MINFDFTTDHEIHPRQRPFEFLNISDRFERQVLPEWAGLDFPISFYTEMEGTDYGSDVTALLHYIQDPLTLIDNKSCIKGKESTVRFLRCEFGTVEEAKRRALILALCTYKITSKTFVPFYTNEMMKKPLILMKLRELWTAFKTHNWKGVDEEAEKKNVKSGEELPDHSGLIVAAEDQTIISNQPYIKIRVKTQKGNIGELEEIVVVEKDVIMTSTKEEVDQLKAKLLESKQEETKELVKHEPRKKEPTDIHIAKSNAFGIAAVDHTKFTTRVNSRKLSKAFSPLRPETDRDRSEYTSSKQSGKNNSSLMKNFDSKYFKYTSSKERAQDMKQIRAQIEEQKRKDIVKMREINQLMKSLGKEEHENNIKLFQKYNEDEKQIIKALISKAKEENLNEKINKKLKIIKQSRRKEIRQSQAKFALNFTRQKNLIEKYEQAGEKSKRIRKEKLEKSSKIRTLKSYKTNKPTIQLSTQLFDASFGEEKTFTKDQSSLNYQATMDTYRTEVLSNSLRKAINSQEPLKHMSAKQSYNSHRFPQNGPNLSIRNSITHEIDDNMSSQRSFNSGAAEHLYPGARSLTRIKYGKQSIIENTIPSIRGMLELPSIRNKPSLGKNSNFRGNYSFM